MNPADDDTQPKVEDQLAPDAESGQSTVAKVSDPRLHGLGPALDALRGRQSGAQPVTTTSLRGRRPTGNANAEPDADLTADEQAATARPERKDAPIENGAEPPEPEENDSAETAADDNGIPAIELGPGLEDQQFSELGGGGSDGFDNGLIRVNFAPDPRGIPIPTWNKENATLTFAYHETSGDPTVNAAIMASGLAGWTSLFDADPEGVLHTDETGRLESARANFQAVLESADELGAENTAAALTDIVDAFVYNTFRTVLTELPTDEHPPVGRAVFTEYCRNAQTAADPVLAVTGLPRMAAIAQRAAKSYFPEYAGEPSDQMSDIERQHRDRTRQLPMWVAGIPDSRHETWLAAANKVLYAADHQTLRIREMERDFRYLDDVLDDDFPARAATTAVRVTTALHSYVRESDVSPETEAQTTAVTARIERAHLVLPWRTDPIDELEFRSVELPSRLILDDTSATEEEEARISQGFEAATVAEIIATLDAQLAGGGTQQQLGILGDLRDRLQEARGNIAAGTKSLAEVLGQDQPAELVNAGVLSAAQVDAHIADHFWRALAVGLESDPVTGDEPSLGWQATMARNDAQLRRAYQRARADLDSAAANGDALAMWDAAARGFRLADVATWLPETASAPGTKNPYSTLAELEERLDLDLQERGLDTPHRYQPGWAQTQTSAIEVDQLWNADEIRRLYTEVSASNEFDAYLRGVGRASADQQAQIDAEIARWTAHLDQLQDGVTEFAPGGAIADTIEATRASWATAEQSAALLRELAADQAGLAAYGPRRLTKLCNVVVESADLTTTLLKTLPADAAGEHERLISLINVMGAHAGRMAAENLETLAGERASVDSEQRETAVEEGTERARAMAYWLDHPTTFEPDPSQVQGLGSVPEQLASFLDTTAATAEATLSGAYQSPRQRIRAWRTTAAQRYDADPTQATAAAILAEGLELFADRTRALAAEATRSGEMHVLDGLRNMMKPLAHDIETYADIATVSDRDPLGRDLPGGIREALGKAMRKLDSWDNFHDDVSIPFGNHREDHEAMRAAVTELWNEYGVQNVLDDYQAALNAAANYGATATSEKPAPMRVRPNDTEQGLEFGKYAIRAALGSNDPEDHAILDVTATVPVAHCDPDTGAWTIIDLPQRALLPPEFSAEETARFHADFADGIATNALQQNPDPELTDIARRIARGELSGMQALQAQIDAGELDTQAVVNLLADHLDNHEQTPGWQATVQHSAGHELMTRALQQSRAFNALQFQDVSTVRGPAELLGEIPASRLAVTDAVLAARLDPNAISVPLFRLIPDERGRPTLVETQLAVPATDVTIFGAGAAVLQQLADWRRELDAANVPDVEHLHSWLYSYGREQARTVERRHQTLLNALVNGDEDRVRREVEVALEEFAFSPFPASAREQKLLTDFARRELWPRLANGELAGDHLTSHGPLARHGFHGELDLVESLIKREPLEWRNPGSELGDVLQEVRDAPEFQQTHQAGEHPTSRDIVTMLLDELAQVARNVAADPTAERAEEAGRLHTQLVEQARQLREPSRLNQLDRQATAGSFGRMEQARLLALIETCRFDDPFQGLQIPNFREWLNRKFPPKDGPDGGDPARPDAGPSASPSTPGRDPDSERADPAGGKTDPTTPPVQGGPSQRRRPRPQARLHIQPLPIRATTVLASSIAPSTTAVHPTADQTLTTPQRSTRWRT